MFKNVSEKNLYLILISVLFLVYSCANIVTPGGGDKDLIPPSIIHEFPPNESINFSSKEIRINFDEYILLRDPLQQIIISPPLNPAPEYQIKKRSLIIKLPDSLRPNTTYTMNFGNSIVDNTEGNPLVGYQYVYSTGSFIDSLVISGKVTSAFTNDPVKDVTVMLYDQMADSLPYKNRPSYFARSNESGAYRISNISANEFKLFALKDENSNYLFDQPSELIGFETNPVNPADTSVHSIKVFINQPEQQRILNSFGEYPGRLIIIFSIPAGEVKLEPIMGGSSSEIGYREFSVNKDTLLIWAADTTRDSLNLIVFHDDIELDTLLIPIRRGRGTPSGFSYSLNVDRNKALAPGDSIQINFNNPVQAFDSSRITILKDSLDPQDLVINTPDTNFRRLYIKFPSEEITKHHLIILPGTFTDIYGNKNDTIIQEIRIRDLRDFGSLSLTINPSDTGNYILQLLDLKGALIREEKLLSRQLNLDFLNPGDYKLKIIIDKNNNGQWDTGNYLKKIQPEPVLYFDERITIRANWFVDQTWNLPTVNN